MAQMCCSPMGVVNGCQGIQAAVCYKAANVQRRVNFGRERTSHPVPGVYVERTAGFRRTDKLFVSWLEGGAPSRRDVIGCYP